MRALPLRIGIKMRVFAAIAALMTSVMVVGALADRPNGSTDRGERRAERLERINANDEGSAAGGGVFCADCGNDNLNTCSLEGNCVECDQSGFCVCALNVHLDGVAHCGDGTPCPLGTICCPNCGAEGECLVPCGGCLTTVDCDDNDACTIDTCKNFACIYSPLDCTDTNPCTNETCDVMNGCQYPLIECDDMDDCTLDGCNEQTGMCVHTNNCCMMDSDCDDNDGCPNDSCDEMTGTCVFNTPACTSCANDSECEDNSNCTQNLCVMGTCQFPLTCVPVDPMCGTAQCDVMTDTCVVVPTDCEDGDDCTTDTCMGGCIHTPIDGCGTPECTTEDDCNDGTQCTSDQCDTGICINLDICGPVCGIQGGGCCEETLGTAGCVDTACCESVCSYDGYCCETEWDGICVGDALTDPNCDCASCGGIDNDCCSSNNTPFCNDESCCSCVCTLDSYCCDTEWDMFCAEEAACECAMACNSQCDPAIAECCVDADCDDGSACTIDSCVIDFNIFAHTCVHLPVGGTASGTGECDGNLCTVDDICMDDTCIPGTPTLCMSDSEPCTIEACNPMSGMCESTPLTGDPCSDGNACTLNDQCMNGMCVGGPAPDCDDGVDCTMDSCDAMLGCVNTPDNTACEDNSVCLDYVCCPVVPSGAASVGACEGTPGCIAIPASGAAGLVECDGNLCTIDDTCMNGICIPGTTMMTCPTDNNPCTDEVCDPMTGMCSSVNDNTNTCSDNNACTLTDTCVNGVCVGTGGPNCDDGVTCTVDTCLPIGGCQNTPSNLLCNDNNDCTTDTCDPATGCLNPCTDTIPPVINCPLDVMVDCNDPIPPFNPTGSDNCDDGAMVMIGTEITIPGTCPQERTIRRPASIMDKCGNAASCIQTVTVVDMTAPVATCPMNQTLECDQTYMFVPTFEDNCDTTPIPGFSDCTVQIPNPTCPENRIVQCSAGVMDDCGNMSGCGTTFTFQDTTPPVIICPPDRVLDCNDPTTIAANGTATAADNCDMDVPVMHAGDISVVNPECPQEFAISRRFRAVDNCGNAAECVQTLTVLDPPPAITCPDDEVVRCRTPEGFPVGELFLEATATDECNTVVSITDDRPAEFYSPTCDGPGNVVTFTATDNCGHQSSCQMRVRVIGGMCCPAIVDTDLKLMPVDLDVRQDNDGPVTTKARFDIWNSNEIRFSGTEKCITCWDETLLSLYPPENNFLVDVMQTDKGKARIHGDGFDGTGNAPCVGPNGPSVENPLLGVSIKEIRFAGSPRIELRAASTLVGNGDQAATLRYDIINEPEESDGASVPVPGDDIVGDGQLQITNYELRTGNNAEMAGSVAALITGVPSVGAGPGAIFDHDGSSFGELADNRAQTTYKGSLLYWPVVELKWDRHGQLIQDTVLQLLNDHPNEVKVQLYLVNGDAPLDAVIDDSVFPPVILERAHPGWNKVDVQITLTGDESAYWSAYSGGPKGVSPFGILDPGNPVGRPDLDPNNPGGRLVRGFMVGWAVNDFGREIRWNHLKGHAMMVHFTDGTAADYNPWSFRCVAGVPEGSEPDGEPGQLLMDGVEYDYAPNQLVFDFYTPLTQPFSHPSARP